MGGGERVVAMLNAMWTAVDWLIVKLDRCFACSLIRVKKKRTAEINFASHTRAHPILIMYNVVTLRHIPTQFTHRQTHPCTHARRASKSFPLRNLGQIFFLQEIEFFAPTDETCVAATATGKACVRGDGSVNG